MEWISIEDVMPKDYEDDDKMYLFVNWEYPNFPMQVVMAKWRSIRRDKAREYWNIKWTHYAEIEPPKQ